MNDDTTTGSQPVNNDNQDQDQDKGVNPLQGQAGHQPVKNDDVQSKKDDVSSQDDIKMTNFNGYKLPEAVYTEIKKASYGEATRKTLEQLNAEGKILSEDKIEKIRTYDTWMESFSDALKKDGEKMTHGEVQKFISDQIRKQTDDLTNTIKAKEKEVDEVKNQLESLNQSIREERRISAIRTSLQKNKSVNPEMIEELVILIDREKSIHIEDDDLETPYIIDPATGNKQFQSSTGDPLTVQEYIDNWISQRPKFLKPAENSGAGLNYGKGKSSEPSVSDFIKSATGKNPIKISQGKFTKIGG